VAPLPSIIVSSVSSNYTDVDFVKVPELYTVNTFASKISDLALGTKSNRSRPFLCQQPTSQQSPTHLQALSAAEQKINELSDKRMAHLFDQKSQILGADEIVRNVRKHLRSKTIAHVDDQAE